MTKTGSSHFEEVNRTGILLLVDPTTATPTAR